MISRRLSARDVRAFVTLLTFSSLFAACAHKPTGKPTAPAPEYEPPRQWAAPSGAASAKQKELPIDGS